MDRRQFFKSMLLTPLFTPMLLASQKTAADTELFLISDVPHLTLPPLLNELPSLGIVSRRTFSLPYPLPQFEELSRELGRRGWQNVPHGQTAHLTLSSSRLQSAVQPSFTLAREGRVWDIRTRKIRSLWEALARRYPPSSLLTIASVKSNPSKLAAGETATLYKDGRRVRNLPLHLDGSRSFRTTEGRIAVTIEKGRAWIAESSCRHKICVHCPPVSHPGERIICAPSRFLLEINGPVSVDTIIGI
jgi:hypothetical protein